MLRHLVVRSFSSQGSSDHLTRGAAAVLEALPDNTRRSLTGEWHGVRDEHLAAVLTDFFHG